MLKYLYFLNQAWARREQKAEPTQGGCSQRSPASSRQHSGFRRKVSPNVVFYQWQGNVKSCGSGGSPVLLQRPNSWSLTGGYQRLWKGLPYLPAKLHTVHCKDTIPKIRNKYSPKRNCTASVPISTVMCLGPILGIYKSLTDTWRAGTINPMPQTISFTPNQISRRIFCFLK